MIYKALMTNDYGYRFGVNILYYIYYTLGHSSCVSDMKNVKLERLSHANHVISVTIFDYLLMILKEE